LGKPTALLSELTTAQNVGIVANMKAVLIYRHRVDFDDGAIMEIVVWKLPKPVPGCVHPYKYRLYYGLAGRRLIGFDNERPKGDHRHTGPTETPYAFSGPEQLIDDFLSEVEKWRTP
jgi:hypothetical protein